MPYLSILLLICLTLPGLSGCERAPDSPQGKDAKKPYRIALLVSADVYVPTSVDGFKEGMRELGYREGENVEYTVYNAKGDRDRLESLARDAVQARPDLLCPSTITAINAVKATGTRIPVVFLESMYPVELRIVKSLAKPETNYTGVSNMTGPMSGKRLELLVRIAPRIERVAVFCNPANQVAVLALETTREAAAKLGIELDVHRFFTLAELDAAIETVRAGPADAVAINPDFMVLSRIKEIAAMALEKKIPTMGIDSSQVNEGILATYGGGLKEIASQAARQTDQILRGGASPGEIPVEAPRKYRLFCNMKTADAIGLRIPAAILYQAEGFSR